MRVIDRNTSCTELATIVSQTLQQAGITAVLSGGAAVSIYTENRYQSNDLDFVTGERIVDLVAALAPLGFVRGSDRHLSHPDSEYYVEFPPGPLAIGGTIVSEWNQLETEFGTLQILSPTQVVMDRLSAYIHWNDLPSLDQAVMVAQNHSLEWKTLQAWCAEDGAIEQYETFRRALRKKQPPRDRYRSPDS
ncbi:MAG: hypothetical protein P8Y44_08075 [Acidobacteriota bacterium]